MKLKFTLLLFTLFLSMNLIGQDYELKVNSPSSVEGTYDILFASFGELNTCNFNITADLVLVEGGSDGITNGCGSISTDFSNSIAVIDRGDCSFIEKCLNAQNQGALAVIVCNNTDGFIRMGGDDMGQITIPCFNMTQADCATLKIEFPFVNGTLERFILEDEFPDDLVHWGNQPGEGDFDGGLNAWVAVSNTCSGGTLGNDGALWEWVADGLDERGSFGDADLPSFSKCNGAAVFNSDWLDNEGNALDPDTGGAIPGELGDGQCVAPQDGELISPVIDLSGAGVTGAIGIKFTQSARQLNTSEFLVGWSLDGGNTWTETSANTDLAGNATVSDIQRIVLPGVNGNVDLSQLRLRFRMAANYYYWIIDDVQIFELKGADARLFNAFDTPLMYGTPRDHADADVYVFSASVENLGGTALENGVMKVEIKNVDTDEVVHTESVNLPTIEIGTRDTFRVNEVDYFPTDLDIGKYSYTYTVDFPGSGEIDFSNNSSQTFFFEITADTFTKEDGNINTSIRLASDQGWSIGSVYLTSKILTEPIVLNKITTSIQSDSARLDNNYVRFVVVKLTGELGFGGGFDRDNPDPTNHPDFEAPIVDEFILFDTQVSEEPFDIQVSTKDNEIILDTASQYVVFAMFDEAQPNGAAMPNNLLRLGVNSVLPDHSDYIVFNNDSPAWFSGFSTFNFSPHLRMTVNMVASGVDNTPLPDHVFKLSPNPASDFVLANINFDQPTNLNLMLADIEGRIISMKDYDAVTQMEERVNVAELTNGTYLMRVSTLEGTKTIKFVVQH